MNPFTFTTCNSIFCEPGASGNLSEKCSSLGMSSVLIVTDRGLIDFGLIKPIVEGIEQNSNIKVSTFSDIQADPPEHVVLDAVDYAKQQNIDGVIGVGGGSSMDVAKLVAALSGNDTPIGEIYGVNQITNPRLPLIQIPTTAGTGSEVTPISIITTGETTKAGIVSDTLLPDIAVLDAELTVGLPPSVTAATGVDAMVHAIEAYTSRLRKNPYSDMLAARALELLSKNIIPAVLDGDNVSAREGMLLGAMLAGQAFANAPVAAVHALAYPLGGHFHVPHGLSNSLVLPEVLRFNADSAGHYYAELLNHLEKQDEPREGFDPCMLFIKEIEKIISAVKLPTKLRECGVSANDLPLLARDAMKQERLLVNNPIPLTEKDAIEIYERVL